MNKYPNTCFIQKNETNTNKQKNEFKHPLK